jgi:hypothetical protein
MFPFSRKDAGFRIQPNAAFRSELILAFQLLGKSQSCRRSGSKIFWSGLETVAFFSSFLDAANSGRAPGFGAR